MDKYPEYINPFDKESSSLFVRVEHLARYLYAAEFIRKRKLRRALDCACGSGYGSIAMARCAESVQAVDRNGSHIERGRAECETKGIGNVAFHAADLNGGLGMIESRTLDCVACFETLEHVEQDELLLREFAQVLRRGRWLLLSAPKAGYEPASPDGRPENPWHLRLYQPDELELIVRNSGFVIEQSIGQPYANMLRANTESFRRDTGASAGTISGFYSDTPEALEYFARVWAWPTAEAEEKSNVALLVCRKV